MAFVERWLIGRAGKQCIPLFGSGEQYRHCLGMDRTHNIVRQKRKEVMLARITPCARRQIPARAKSGLLSSSANQCVTLGGLNFDRR
jgi:hypothetical protein